MTEQIKKAIGKLYPAQKYAEQIARYERLENLYKENFGTMPEHFFSAPGRSEICGNHTDHNFGKVMAAAIELDVAAAATADDDGLIVVASDTYPTVIVDTDDLEKKPEEEGTSAAIVRGIAAKMKADGYKIGGLKAVNTTNVLKGSGMSSSAAFEILVCTMLNDLYNDGKMDAVKAAQISQYAENVYFGKPSGLMDQMACSVGGFVEIDFKNPSAPEVTPLSFDFGSTGYRLVITDCHADHADATGDYAAIRADMAAAAEVFGKKYLRQVDETKFYHALDKVRAAAGDLGVLRACHFFEENKTVTRAAAALKADNFETFKECIIASGRSSFMYLQNIYCSSAPRAQALSVALCVSEKILSGHGAWRIHGGGFGGTIQAFVPEEKLSEYIGAMEMLFGENCCYPVSVRSVGGYMLG